MKVKDVRVPLAAIASTEDLEDGDRHMIWIEEAVREASQHISVLLTAQELISENLFINGIFAVQKRLEALAETVSNVRRAELEEARSAEKAKVQDG